ncbi:NAD-dependent epimerase/dehydratase family protein [Kaistia sp. UC242_56]|uniref:NAD-dependent epimerase/dehydratase family protein n=1 Tax=Kaistia sp. UC242_56 TaxID=3374625 RepID=UPI00378BFDA3
MTVTTEVPCIGATKTLVPFRRIFLTGGSGYVGRNLIRHFRDRNMEVVALVRSAASAETVQDLGATPYHGDMLSSDIGEGMAGCDALIHAAADTNHGPGTRVQTRVNEDGTRIVFEAACKAGIRRAIHISSESVLADGRPLVHVDESAKLPRKPAGNYSRSKAAAERIALASNRPGFAVVALRPRLVWGRDDTTALPQLCAAARSGKFAWIDGGTYLTSTTHVPISARRSNSLCLRVGLARYISFPMASRLRFASSSRNSWKRKISSQLTRQSHAVCSASLPRLEILSRHYLEAGSNRR